MVLERTKRVLRVSIVGETNMYTIILGGDKLH